MLYNTLLRRRSIRTFTKRAVEPEKRALLTKAALLSPSSRNIRPWSFVVVDNPETIARLSKAKPHGAGFLETATLAVVIAADTTASDVWVEDTAIAGTILLLMADELALGACWCQIRKRPHDDDISADQYVRRLLGLPETFAVASIIGFGYPETPRPEYDESELRYDKVFYNAYGNRLDEPS